MSSERRHLRRVLIATAIVAGVLACSSSEASVGCSPTPTCSWHASRLEPPPTPDAGRMPCGPEHCHGEEIAAGGRHDVMVSELAEVLTWGSDEDGQRGDGPPLDGGMPERFPEVLADARHAAAGSAHSCALLTSGEVSCWGRNVEGQVDGVGSAAPIDRPTSVAGVNGATDIDAGGAHTCVVTAEGVVCWGSARFGQVGRMVAEAVLPPGLVSGTAGAIDVDAGVRHTCARFAGGRVACWGELIGDGGAAEATAAPRDVPGLTDATSIGAGAGHTCAVRLGGQAVCWGDNASGQLGNGTTTPSAVPVDVVELPDAQLISAGGIELGGALVGDSCAITQHFTVVCWGRNTEGQLGDRTANDSAIPVEVREDDEDPLEDVIQLSSGGLHNCGVDESGDGFCWGANDADQLGHAGPFGEARQVAVFH